MFGRAASAGPVLRGSDLRYVSPLRAAQQVEGVHAVAWTLALMLGAVAAAVTWAAVSKVDVIAKAPARVLPDGREQLIASLEGGILRELKVREGEAVEAGQALVVLDPTRMAAQRSEGQSRRIALKAAIARAQAEASGGEPRFPREVAAAAAVAQGEAEAFRARARVLREALEVNQRNLELLNRELSVAESMSAKGLMSEVEVMRLRRQANELQQSSAERLSRHRQEAAAELVRLRNELALTDEQQVVRDDALRRTVLASPVRGIVKSIRNASLGGVVAPGAPILEVVPQGDQVLVELRIKPSDIGFVQPGQEVQVKLSTYDYTTYGALHGRVETISPDALGDPDKGGENATWYRALVRTPSDQLQSLGRALPVRPGMQGDAEIRTGQRTVMSFLLRRILRVQEAFTER